MKRDGVSFSVNQHGTVSKQIVEKIYISEGNLYRLIVCSKLPSAEHFERWVFDEVLPTIRKYGFYANPEVLKEMLSNSEYATGLLRELQAERVKSASFQEIALEMTPKALYCDLILQSKNSFGISVIAKVYGLSATAFNLLLHNLGIQYKVGDTWPIRPLRR